jgi:hypothetical protein
MNELVYGEAVFYHTLLANTAVPTHRPLDKTRYAELKMILAGLYLEDPAALDYYTRYRLQDVEYPSEDDEDHSRASLLQLMRCVAYERGTDDAWYQKLRLIFRRDEREGMIDMLIYTPGTTRRSRMIIGDGGVSVRMGRAFAMLSASTFEEARDYITFLQSHLKTDPKFTRWLIRQGDWHIVLAVYEITGAKVLDDYDDYGSSIIALARNVRLTPDQFRFIVVTYLNSDMDFSFHYWNPERVAILKELKLWPTIHCQMYEFPDTRDTDTLPLRLFYDNVCRAHWPRQLAPDEQWWRTGDPGVSIIVFYNGMQYIVTLSMFYDALHKIAHRMCSLPFSHSPEGKDLLYRLRFFCMGQAPAIPLVNMDDTTVEPSLYSKFIVCKTGDTD